VFSASQARRRRGEPLRQGVSFDRVCVECNGAFVALKGNARWCSSECRRRFTAREESRRRGPARPDAEPYTDREIFERDGWICQLCRLPVDPEVSRRAGEGATIDHTIPLSMGGADKRDNVVTAHNRCNRAKAESGPR
jgi:5-methylcytosine-specific restriction endonuclease McrA